MSSLSWAERLLLGSLAGIAMFAVAAHALLALSLAVPAHLLTGSLLLGLLVPWRIPAMPAAAPAPRWLASALGLVLVAALVAIAYGALATPSRHWDGAVAWDTTARFLVAAPTLEQPYFRDAAVFAHSRDYPLLQPLLVATLERLCGGAGRLLFPGLFALLALLVGTTLRRATANASLAWLGTAATMLTPMLVNPTSGGIDSGYGEGFLLLCTTAIAAGFVQKDARLLLLGTLLAVLVKPEGIVYAGAATAVAFCTAERRLLCGAAAGWLLGAVAWLPLQRGLLQPEAGTSCGWFVVAAGGIGALLACADALARRAALGPRGRLAAAAVLLPVLLLALPLVASGVGASGGAMQSYLAEPGRLLQRSARLPAIVVGVLHYALFRGGFGLAYWLPLVALFGAWSRRASFAALGLFVLAGLGIVVMPFLMGQETDLQHQLRSSMPRLLLHWLGPTMLLGVTMLGQCRERSSTEAQPHRGPSPEAQR